ncbi:MAG: hypothetical protein M1587_01190 [Thaumarchaeota archaeon]|nr:hypothetical protein [Nitrososphaerota archaeon]
MDEAHLHNSFGTAFIRFTKSPSEKMTANHSENHEHEFRYYAAVNLDINNETVGVIDVWQCASCHVKSADLRAQGLNNLATEAGFRSVD